MGEVHQVETLIIGAGVIGSSVAMHLAQAGMTHIRVLDFDLEGSFSSSELNAGGVRATWVQPINIQLSKASIEYFASVAQEVGYRACGYLWLHPASRMEAALKARETQVKMGWPVDVLDLTALGRHAPFIDKTEGIAGALFAPQDGLINPNLLKNHYRLKSKALGVVYDDRTLVKSVEFKEAGKWPVRITAERFSPVLTEERKREVLSQQGVGTESAGAAGSESSQGVESEPNQVFKSDSIGSVKNTWVHYQAERVINCAGPWAEQVAQLLHYQSPAYPLRRQVCIFDCKGLDLTPYGMIVDTSGVYFHPEASNGLAGFAPVGEPPGINFDYEGESLFMDVIWPALFERSTHFERLKHLTGWSGLYEVSPDDCAILGPVSYSSDRMKERVFEAHSFSGHGVMQSYSAGRALSERIVGGRFESIDLNCLSAERFQRNEFIHENLII